MDTQTLRIDSTVIASNISAPSDSQLLCDGIRVLSRLMARSLSVTGIKIHFADYRKAAKSLAFRIFNAGKAGKEQLYPALTELAEKVVLQAQHALDTVRMKTRYFHQSKTGSWRMQMEHYLNLVQKVNSQTRRRVIVTALPAKVLKACLKDADVESARTKLPLSCLSY